MNYPGTDLKFRITTTHPAFNLSENDFEIQIKDLYGRLVQTVAKDDCLLDEQGRYYFVMNNPKKGIYYAFFSGSYEDEDYADKHRDFTDSQELCRVAYRGASCHCRCRHMVQYEQVWEANVGEDS